MKKPIGQVTHCVVNPPVQVLQTDEQQGPGLVELKWYPVEQEVPVHLDEVPLHVLHSELQAILILYFKQSLYY